MTDDWSNQTILGRFRVDVRLSNAGEAFRAWDNLTNQAVCLHILPNLPDDETGHLLEGRGVMLSRFSHPGIKPYIGYFEFSGRAFWAEGYLDAPTLYDVLACRASQPLSLQEALTYLKSLSTALTALHSAGWAHANLCPENIQVNRTGRILLGGLFSARRLGEIPPVASTYTPPDAALSPAYDIYALGRILFETLAGSLPRPLPDLRKLNPDIPEFLARQLPRALDVHPATRISNATEFFLTACLACHLEPASVPDRVALDSVSAQTLAAFEFLPALEPPRSLPAKPLIKEGNRPAIGLWATLTITGLLLGISGWFLLGRFSPPASQHSALPSQTPQTIQPMLLQVKGVPTLPAVPSLAAPDGLGGKIVFTCTRSDLNQLCMIAPTGGEVVRFTSGSAHDYYPSFSPAGNMVLYASNRNGGFDLYLKLLDSDILNQVTQNIGEVSSASFSPDGTQIVFSNSIAGQPSELWQISRDGKDPHKLYSGDGNIASPVWAPNGQSIAFAMSSAADLAAYDVYILDPLAETVGAVTKGRLPNAGGSVDWSPDGHTLLLFAGPPGDKDIYLFDIVSGHLRQLTDGGNNAAAVFSPDGRWIAFNSQRKGNADIFIMKPDGSDVRQLTSDPEPDWQPRWGR